MKFQNEDIAIWQFVYKVVLVTRVYSDSWRNIHKKKFVSSSKNALEKKKKKENKKKGNCGVFALCTNAISQISELFMSYTQTKKEARNWWQLKRLLVEAKNCIQYYYLFKCYHLLCSFGLKNFEKVKNDFLIHL